jgi:hypothetical protein
MSGDTLPNIVSFDPSTRTYTVYSSDSTTASNQYQIVYEGSRSGYNAMTQSCTWILVIVSTAYNIPTNTAPYFVSNLVN